MAISLATRQEFTPSRAAMRSSPARATYLRPVQSSQPADPLECELHRVGTSVAVPRGRLVAEQGSPAEYIFRVERGAARVVRQLADGRRCITRFLMPGDYFGLADNGTYKSSVEAIIDARVIRYQRTAIDRLCEQNPSASRRLLALVGRQLSAVQDSLVLVGQKSALERLSTFLLFMAERSEQDRSVVALPMDRSDIADYLGLRIETVSRVLTALRRRKVIDLPNFHSFVILDRGALESATEGDD